MEGSRILVYWDAPVKGFEALNKLLSQFKSKNIKVDTLVYIYCSYMGKSNFKDNNKMTTKDRIKTIESDHPTNNSQNIIKLMESLKIKIETLPLDINQGKADDFESIKSEIEDKLLYGMLREKNPEKIYICLESGTFTMRALWISLYAQSKFTRIFGEGKTELWSIPNEASISQNKGKKEFRKLEIPQIPIFDKLQNTKYQSNKLTGYAKNDNLDVNLDIEGDIKKSATIDAPLLILGERGTGKSFIVDQIAKIKLCMGFIKDTQNINESYETLVCGMLDNNIIESELFGYEPGAFTGARKDGYQGIFERCNGKMIFLDEIQDIPKVIQRKILRVLEEHKVRRMSSKDEKEVKFSLVCASNASLNELQEKLDDDFFDRICRFKCELKPLRELPDEIIEKLWKNRWLHYKDEEKFALPDEPDDFTLVKEALLKSKMYGNIRDINQLIAYITRDVYEGEQNITDANKKEKYKKAVELWQKDYNIKYSEVENKTNNEKLAEETIEKLGWKEIEKQFKNWLADYVLDKCNNNIPDAAKKLKTTERTIKNNL